jgi:prepilin-type N-terminal cleavage/methylation domain-containing protein
LRQTIDHKALSHTRRNEQGFTLVELAISLAVLGLLLAAIISLLSTRTDRSAFDLTEKRQKIIVRALNNFAQQNNRLPCPSDPNGVNLGLARPTCPAPANRDGVLPFRDLGLTQDQATDGYGNPFTYIVAGAAVNPAAAQIHAMCRTDSWVAGGNRNPDKATFCCQRINNANDSIQVIRDPDPFVLAQSTQLDPIAPQIAPPAISFDADNVVALTVNDNQVVDYIVYAVISHGANGELSYIWNQPARKPANAVVGAQETENANNDATVTDWWEIVNTVTGEVRRIRNDADNVVDHYDDIVVWSTQRQAMMGMQNNTCSTP